MLDFTSALYLGMQHPSTELRPWTQLTTGRPAALAEPPLAREVAGELAKLQGCEEALLLPSTLHLFMDLFEVLSTEPVAIFLEAGSYPIARWSAERIRTRNVKLIEFPHHDPGGLAAALSVSRGKRPVVVTDGFCPDCGVPAPLSDYLAVIRRHSGLLVLDDTQALGVLGSDAGPVAPYGVSGGGSLAFAKVHGPEILVGSSLAKGFGVPVAVLAGSRDMMKRYIASAPCRTHCSPPSAAAIHAAEHALAVNQRHGNGLRLVLADRVRRFRRGLRRIGLAAGGGLFPVQILKPVFGMDPMSVHRALWRQGIRAVPLKRRGPGTASVGFLFTARHGHREIDHCLSILEEVKGLASRRLDRPGDGHAHGALLARATWHQDIQDYQTAE